MTQAETFKVAMRAAGRVLSSAEIDEIPSRHEAQVTHYPNASVAGATTDICEFRDAFRFRTPAFRGWGDAVNISIATQVKQIVKGSLVNLHGVAEGEAVFDNWSDKPDSWWRRRRRAPTLMR